MRCFKLLFVTTLLISSCYTNAARSCVDLLQSLATTNKLLPTNEFQELNAKSLEDIRETLVSKINQLSSEQAKSMMDSNLKAYLKDKHQSSLARINNGDIYDVVVIGAGVSGGQFVSGLSEMAKKANRPIKSLLIEKSDRVANNFNSLRFTLNSAEAYVHPDNPHLGEIVRLTDHNPMPGSPLSVLESGVMMPLDHRIEHQKFLDELEKQEALVFPWSDHLGFNIFPRAKWLGRSSELAIYSSNSDIVFNTQAFDVVKRKDDVYVLTTSEGDVFAKNVVMATGLGEDRIPFSHPRSLRTNKGGIAQVATFSDLLAAVRTPQAYGQLLSDLKGKKVLVIGKGDGGNVAIEYLTGLADPSVKPSDLPQVSWSSIKTQSKESFLDSLGIGKRGSTSGGPLHHQRYQEIGNLIDEKKIELISYRVDFIEKSNEGRLRVNFQSKSVSQEFDYVIAATGYENKSFPWIEKGVFQTVRDSQNRPLALMLKREDEALYMVGNMGQVFGPLLDHQTIRNSRIPNQVALFNHIPRAFYFGQSFL